MFNEAAEQSPTVTAPYTRSIVAELKGQHPVTAFEDAVDASPVSSGNFMFYAKPRNRQSRVPSSSVYQLQLGVVAYSPESFDVSQQLDQYLLGIPVEMVAITAKPPTVFFRSTGQDNGIYLYRYIDASGNTERLWDSWSRWNWHEQLGTCCGIAEHDGDLLVFTVRNGTDPDDLPRWWVACDRFSLDTGLSDYPYLDSLRSLNGFHEPAADTWLHIGNAGTVTEVCAAFSAEADEFLVGTTGDRMLEFLESYGEEARALMLVGLPYLAEYTPSNPYIKDYQGRPVLDGRLVVGRVRAALTQSSGCVVTVNDTVVHRSRGRTTGFAVLGEQPVETAEITAAVGRETRSYTLVFKANTWLPLTLSALSWRGQYFNNARRV